jgi:hypothetical protein
MLPSGVRCCRIFVVASAAASEGNKPATARRARAKWRMEASVKSPDDISTVPPVGGR